MKTRMIRLTTTMVLACLALLVAWDAHPTMACAAPARDIPDLSKEEDYRAFNIFLSNFSEGGVGLSMYANEREFVSLSASPEHLARFAFTNYAQNGGAYETMSNARWNVRVPVAKLDAILERLCGTTLDDWSELNSTSSSFLYEDGYVYTQITNGFPLNGPAVTTSVEGWRKGTFRVEFDAYSYPKEKTGYKIGDRSQYSMTEPQLNNLLGVSGPDRRGYAIVWANKSDGEWKIQLVKYVLY